PGAVCLRPRRQRWHSLSCRSAYLRHDNRHPEASRGSRSHRSVGAREGAQATGAIRKYSFGGMSELRTLKSEIRRVATPDRARINKWFFKTAPGDYGEGDRFLGVSVPQLRVLARTYQDLALRDLDRLLQSPWHEERLLALLILVRQHARGDAQIRRAIHRLYLRNTRRI